MTAAKRAVITLCLALIELHTQSWVCQKPQEKSPSTDAVFTQSSMVFINNYFSVCCKPLVDFLSAEMVVCDSCVELYGVLGEWQGTCYPPIMQEYICISV